MNERIQELAEQASLYAVSDNSAMQFDVWKKRYTEKFAELIIKECLFAIVSSVDRPAFERKIYHGIIKDCFGVSK